MYTCGIEPASTYPLILTDAIKQGSQLQLEPGKTLETRLLAVAYSGSQRVTRISAEGDGQRR